MVINGLPGREVFGQHPPMATRLVQVEYGVDYVLFAVPWDRPALVRRLEIGLDKPPFFLRNITIVHIIDNLLVLKSVII
jgi:hypothetical protein